MSCLELDNFIDVLVYVLSALRFNVCIIVVSPKCPFFLDAYVTESVTLVNFGLSAIISFNINQGY